MIAQKNHLFCHYFLLCMHTELLSVPFLTFFCIFVTEKSLFQIENV